MPDALLAKAVPTVQNFWEVLRLNKSGVANGAVVDVSSDNFLELLEAISFGKAKFYIFEPLSERRCEEGFSALICSVLVLKVKAFLLLGFISPHSVC